LLLVGCSQSTKNTVAYHSYPDLKKTKRVLKKDVNQKLPMSVAILPFKSEKKEISFIVTNAFYNYFSILPYNDVEISRVREVFSNKMFSLDTDKKTLKEVCKRLGVDGIIYGDVENFGKLFAGIYSEVSVGTHLKFYSLKADKVIWEFKDIAKKREGGIATTPLGIALNVALSLYNLRKLQVYRAAEDLFRDIPKLVPHRKYNIADTISPPSYIYHLGMKKDIFGIGDKVDFFIKAEENLRVYVQIPGVQEDIKLNQTEPGVYRGKYIVKPNDNAQGYLKIVLISNTAKKVYYDTIAKINIDTTPPSAPIIDVDYADTISITVKDKKGDEIGEYVLEVLDGNKYKKYKTSKDGRFQFETSNKTLTIRARSKDRARNLSKPSEAIRLYLYDDKNIANSTIYKNEHFLQNIKRIEKDTTLDDLYIAKNGYLIIMPGVNVTIPKGAKIVADGTLSIVNANVNIDNKSIIIKGKLKVVNSTIYSTTIPFILKNSAIANIKKTKINSSFSSISLEDASYLEAIDSVFDSNDVFGAVTITGNACAKIVNSRFSEKPLYAVVSNSAKKTIVEGSKVKIQGNIDVKNN